jgi:hypothetical protein
MSLVVKSIIVILNVTLRNTRKIAFETITTAYLSPFIENVATDNEGTV